MKWICVLLALALPALMCGQASRQSYSYDLNGNRVAGPTVESADGVRTQRMQSINGRKVPVEQTEERVLSSDSKGKTVERIVRRFSPEGQALPPERVVVEEHTGPEGGTTVRTTVFQSDVNGNARVVERSTAEVRRSGGSSTSEMVVERPSVDGGLEASERRVTVESKSAAGGNATTTVFKPDTNGRFSEFARETVERQNGASGYTETSSRFEAGQLLESRRSTTVKQPDGSESVVVDVYAAFSPGLANVARGELKIKEQQIIQRRVEGGGVVESVSVRRPSLGDPERLGGAVQVGETRCVGKCR